MSYRTFEHPADIGLEIDAPDMAGVLSEAARAFQELAVPAAELVPQDGWRAVDVRAADREELLVEWLDELLFQWDAHGVLLLDVAVDEVELGAEGARAVGRGRPATVGAGASVDTEVKAVTFHGLAIRERDGGLRATVVLDV